MARAFEKSIKGGQHGTLRVYRHQIKARQVDFANDTSLQRNAGGNLS